MLKVKNISTEYHSVMKKNEILLYAQYGPRDYHTKQSLKKTNSI